MGQKTNPQAFRLNISTLHKNILANTLKQNKQNFFSQKLLTNILNIFLKDLLVTYSINFNSFYGKNEKYIIKLNILIPNKKELKIKNINSFITFLKYRTILIENYIKKTLNINIKIQYKLYSSPWNTPEFITEMIKLQIEKRIPFLKVLNNTIEYLKAFNLRGGKIQLSGRLNGIEIARNEFLSFGKLPLQTLNESILYTENTANTIYGNIGIKLWILI